MGNVTDYNEMSSTDLMVLMQNPENDQKTKLKLSKALRHALRRESLEIEEEIKKENEDTKEQQKALAATKKALQDARKDMLEAYRKMNSIINTKSMLKNFDEFEKLATTFIGKDTTFILGLKSHLKKLKEVKEKDHS